MYGYSQTKTFLVGREWLQICHVPVDEEDYTYSVFADRREDNLFQYTLLIGITGTTNAVGLSAPFEWEIVQHIEFIGSVDAITASHSDIVGMSQIRNASISLRATSNPQKKLAQTLGDVGNAIMHVASPMVQRSIESSESASIIRTLMSKGSQAMSYVSNLAGTIERGALTSLQRTFSGGLLARIAPYLASLAL